MLNSSVRIYYDGKYSYKIKNSMLLDPGLVAEFELRTLPKPIEENFHFVNLGNGVFKRVTDSYYSESLNKVFELRTLNSKQIKSLKRRIKNERT